MLSILFYCPQDLEQLVLNEFESQLLENDIQIDVSKCALQLLLSKIAFDVFHPCLLPIPK